MREAIRLAMESVEEGGGPFGAVIVRDGTIIGRGKNRVTLIYTPTAHAEVEAIRNACREQQVFHLDGCELYVNCQPCPMCLSAAYWAHIEKVYYAATADDAAEIGFDDRMIWEELCKPMGQRKLSGEQHLRDTALEVFKKWQQKEDKTEY